MQPLDQWAFGTTRYHTRNLQQMVTTAAAEGRQLPGGLYDPPRRIQYTAPVTLGKPGIYTTGTVGIPQKRHTLCGNTEFVEQNCTRLLN